MSRPNLSDLEVFREFAFENDGETGTDDVTDEFRNIKVPLQLEYAMLHFVLQSSRIFFIDQVEMWENFFNSNEENSLIYRDFVAKDLCEHFQYSMLPYIFDYEITRAQESMLNFLDMNEDFERVSTGFKRLEPNLRSAHKKMAKPNKNFYIANNNASVQNIIKKRTQNGNHASCSEPKRLKLDTEKLKRNIRTIVVPPSLKKSGAANSFDFSKENIALLSAAFSSEDELATQSLLTTEQLRDRMRKAKEAFEKTGRLPENLLNEDELVLKIERWKRVQDSMVNVTSKNLLQK
ncbi:uncharacterized protein LOC119671118 [Teleopsis dalmanni]|uniref:uncharacterized protein LOC119671118 n=1 Tax=Teleopsis dalmanni TaxID=139649 RepID=UPI0018CF76FB|nr:uncharacterized protein LOC119671118 [Teleopsis dalmanni]